MEINESDYLNTLSDINESDEDNMIDDFNNLSVNEQKTFNNNLIKAFKSKEIKKHLYRYLILIFCPIKLI